MLFFPPFSFFLKNDFYLYLKYHPNQMDVVINDLDKSSSLYHGYDDTEISFLQIYIKVELINV